MSVIIGGEGETTGEVVDVERGLESFQLPASLDAFARLRVGLPETIFDSKFLNDALPLYWDDAVLSGTGTTSTWNTNQASVALGVTSLTAGSRARQTFRRFPYLPGKSHFIALTGALGGPATGITRRIGSFDAKNGVFFESNPTAVRTVIRSYTSGVAVDTAVAQSAWNVDRMDGTGPSGVTLDFSKTQIFVVDFQWLGVGAVRFGFYLNGIVSYCHRVDNGNSLALVYMSTPNLPLRYEITNSGTGGAATLLQICSAVIQEGGPGFTGSTRCASRAAASPLVTLNSTALFPLAAIRLKAGYEGAGVKPEIASIVCTTNSAIEVQLILNPTVTGTALSFSSVVNSAVETDVAATNASTITGGTLLASGLVTAGGDLLLDKATDLQLGSSIAGVNDILVVAVRRLTGTTETIFGSITWRETN